MIIFNATAIHAISAVYAYNKSPSPVTLEVTVHYYRKKVPSKAYGGYTVVPSDSTETLSIPLKSGRNTLAEFLLIDRVIVQKAVITTQSGIVTVPINHTVNLTTGMESHYDESYTVIDINPDTSFSIKQESYS